MRKILTSSLGPVLAGALALAAASAAPALADQPGARGDFAWSGLYAGLHAGWAEADYDISGTGGIFDGNLPLPTLFTADDIFGGGTLGFNWQLPLDQPGLGLVFGLEGDIGHLGAAGSNIVPFGGVGPLGADDNYAEVKYGFYMDFTGRLGAAIDNYLLYAKGGIAFADIRNTAADVDGGAIDTADFTTTSGLRTGYVIGGGVEGAIDEVWSLKAEYLYFDFGKTTSTNLDGDTWRHDNSVHSVKIGLNAKLDGLLPGLWP